MEPCTSFSKSSAFRPVAVEKSISDYIELMQHYGRQIAQTGERIQISENFEYSSLPSFIKLILNTMIYLLRGCCNTDISETLVSEVTKNPCSIKVRLSLMKTIFILIQKKICSYQPEKYHDEFCFSLLFKVNMLGMLSGIISQHSNEIQIQKLLDFHSYLVGSTYNKGLSKLVFSMYGGSKDKIGRKDFTENLNNAIKSLTSHYTEAENLIMRNSQFIKNKEEMKKSLDSLIMILANFQNKNYVKECVQKTVQKLFAQESQIQSAKFTEEVDQCIENSSEAYLWIYFDLLRLELQLLSCQELKDFILKKDSLDPCNYYKESMQKILKKCPYNGHESCNCKKCQCIRRNRESAKLSQQKKRNAVQQVSQMQEKIENLEKRNRELQEMNGFLMTIFNQMKSNSEFKNMLRGTAEQINKVMKNE